MHLAIAYFPQVVTHIDMCSCFVCTGDGNAPYMCTTLINKISYGQGSSLNKKQAKQLAGMCGVSMCIMLLIASDILLVVFLSYI